MRVRAIAHCMSGAAIAAIAVLVMAPTADAATRSRPKLPRLLLFSTVVLVSFGLATAGASAAVKTFQSVGVIYADGPSGPPGGPLGWGYRAFIGFRGVKYHRPVPAPTCANDRRYHLFSVKDGLTTEVASGVTSRRKDAQPFWNSTFPGVPSKGAFLNARITVPDAHSVLPTASQSGPQPAETSVFVTVDKRVIRAGGKIVAICQAATGPSYLNTALITPPGSPAVP